MLPGPGCLEAPCSSLIALPFSNCGWLPTPNLRHVALLSLAGDRATVYVGGRREEVSTSEVQRVWRGRATILWQMPPGYRGPSRRGDNDATSAWLAERLALLAGDRIDGNGAFDGALEERLRSFQREAGLRPDGVAGPRTWMRLNDGTGVGAPVLRGSRGGPGCPTFSRPFNARKRSARTAPPDVNVRHAPPPHSVKAPMHTRLLNWSLGTILAVNAVLLAMWLAGRSRTCRPRLPSQDRGSPLRRMRPQANPQRPQRREPPRHQHSRQRKHPCGRKRPRHCEWLRRGYPNPEKAKYRRRKRRLPHGTKPQPITGRPRWRLRK